MSGGARAGLTAGILLGAAAIVVLCIVHRRGGRRRRRAAAAGDENDAAAVSKQAAAAAARTESPRASAAAVDKDAAKAAWAVQTEASAAAVADKEAAAAPAAADKDAPATAVAGKAATGAAAAVSPPGADITDARPSPDPPTPPAFLGISVSDVTASTFASAGAYAMYSGDAYHGPGGRAGGPPAGAGVPVTLTDTATTVYALGPAAAGAQRLAAGHPGPPPPLPPALYDTVRGGGRGGAAAPGAYGQQAVLPQVPTAGSISDFVDVDALFRPPSGPPRAG